MGALRPMIDPQVMALLSGAPRFCASCKQDMPANHDQFMCGRLCTALDSIRGLENQVAAIRVGLTRSGVALQ